MAIQPDTIELIDQQQHDRRQLLLYAERLDAMSNELRRQAETIEHLTEQHAERLEAMSNELRRQAETIEHLTEQLAACRAEREQLREAGAADSADMDAKREHDAAALAELRAWREAMERSRTYRLMQRLSALYRLPLIGPVLRALR